MLPGEFAHIHPPHDGSLHMVLPETAFDHAMLQGWGEPHPAAGRFGTPRAIAMIYGSRDEAELRGRLVFASPFARICHDEGLSFSCATGLP